MGEIAMPLDSSQVAEKPTFHRKQWTVLDKQSGPFLQWEEHHAALSFVSHWWQWWTVQATHLVAVAICTQMTFRSRPPAWNSLVCPPHLPRSLLGFSTIFQVPWLTCSRTNLVLSPNICSSSSQQVNGMTNHPVANKPDHSWESLLAA